MSWGCQWCQYKDSKGVGGCILDGFPEEGGAGTEGIVDGKRVPNI